MKGTKIITLATTLALMASFTGCSDKENKSIRSLASAYAAAAEKTEASRETAARVSDFNDTAAMAQPEEYVPESTAASLKYEKFDIGTYCGEQLTWTVLKVEGNRALLLSDKVVDMKPYNTDKNDFTWENCSLRKWLNEDFYGKAFSAEEQQMIVKTTVHNKDITVHGYSLGNDTEDYIYILSSEEMSTGRNVRKAGQTQTAKDNSPHGRVFRYWRRDPATLTSYGYDYMKMCTMECDGNEVYYGSSLNSKEVGVRPAMWVNVDMLVNNR